MVYYHNNSDKAYLRILKEKLTLYRKRKRKGVKTFLSVEEATAMEERLKKLEG